MGPLTASRSIVVVSAKREIAENGGPPDAAHPVGLVTAKREISN